MLLLDENLSYKLVSRLIYEFPDTQAVIKEIDDPVPGLKCEHSLDSA